MLYLIHNGGVIMQLFGKKKEQVTEPVLEEVEFEEDQLFELDLDNVIAGVPEEFAREKLSELDQMMNEQKQTEEITSSAKISLLISKTPSSPAEARHTFSIPVVSSICAIPQSPPGIP